ncbi:ABC transporter substrate-binding protein [Bacillus massiliigorillae]|uniref:ABC transporter substrate-binding protein n=1 Tax=Bacillus massiliigorillae TaxID=1243664 RepID=UPI0003A3F3C8|nr:ABC transporter substrate-binding protein [Bacillus massiliigorillae]
MKKKFGMIALVLMLLLSMAACSSDSSSGSESSDDKGKKQKLVVVDWGGAITDLRKKVMFEPFEKKYNVEIVLDTPTDYGKLKAMVESGNVTWDVVKIESFFAMQAEEKGLLEPLDFNVIDKEGTIPAMVTGSTMGVELFTNTMAYREDNKNKPKTWKEFWDTKNFPGARSLFKAPAATLEMALLADGVPVKELYPIDVDRAFKSLDKLKPQIKTWWNAGAQPPQMLADGNVAYSVAWNGRIALAKKDGSPLAQDYTEGLMQGESWVIPKGAKNAELANKFIAFVATAEIQAEWSRQTDYLPANLKALDLLNDDDKKRLGIPNGEISTDYLVNEQWWVENYEEVNDRFQKWLLE